MVFSTPVFWHHPSQLQPLPSASGDAKARNLLRRIRRGGYTAVSDTGNDGDKDSHQEHYAGAGTDSLLVAARVPASPPAMLATGISTCALATPATTLLPPPPNPFTSAADDDVEGHVATDDDPPEYALDALPGYTPLPRVRAVAKPSSPPPPPAQPQARRRYLHVLKRRISSRTWRRTPENKGAVDEEGDGEGDEGGGTVVLYRRDAMQEEQGYGGLDDSYYYELEAGEDSNAVGWVKMDEGNGDESAAAVRPRTFKGWLRKVWRGVKTFSKEHPHVFLLAVFFLLIVALCVLI